MCEYLYVFICIIKTSSKFLDGMKGLHENKITNIAFYCF